MFASGSDAVAIEFEAKQAEQEKVDSIVDRLFSAVAAKFKPAEPVTPTPANDNFDPANFATDMRPAFSGSLTAALKPVTDAHAALQRELATLKTQLAATEQPGFSRAPASGAGDDAVTDC